MDLNYDLGDKSENLRRMKMNHLKNLIRFITFFLAENATFFVYFGVKDW